MEIQNMNMFLVGTRHKLRFPFKGSIRIEDLWDLSLEELDSLYGLLLEEQGAVKGGGLLNYHQSKADLEIELKLGIVKEVFEYLSFKKQEATAARKRADTRQKVMEIMASKKDDALKGKSMEELQALLDSL